MKKQFFVVAAVIFSSTLEAQFVQDSTGKLLDEAVITASKFEQKQSQTGKVITVITKSELEKSNGKTLGQVLNEQAGVTIAGAYTNAGGVQTVFTRGASSGRTLILLDGIPVSDPSMINNEFDLNLFSIHDIERIEICKGAQSTLYGSDAVAGVINIITVKKDISTPFNIKALMGFGNKNTIRNSAQLYGRINNKFKYTTRFSKLSTDGFSAAHDSTSIRNYDRDNYDGHVISTGLEYDPFYALTLKGFVQYSRYKAAIDAGVFKDDRDFTIRNSNLAIGGGARYRKGIVTVTANYQYGDLKRRYLNDSLHITGFAKYERNHYQGKSRYAEIFGNIEIKSWLTLLAGFDYRFAGMNQQYLSISSSGPYSSEFDDSTLHQTSFYASVFFSGLEGKLNLELGGRVNDHSRYGSNSTYTFNPSYKISDHWRIFGSIASGFKAPSIYQVYDAYSGNRDLKPERSTNYELGIQQSHSKIGTRVVYFHREIKDGIDYDYVNSKYFNFVKQTVNGLELELSARPTSKLNISANYTFLHGEEMTQSRKDFSNRTYDYLLRRPKHSFNAGFGYQFCESFLARLSGKTVSDCYDVGGFMADDVLVESYFILNAYAEYKYGRYVKFFADLQNITDKKFVDIRGYNAIPFMISGGIIFNMQ